MSQRLLAVLTALNLALLVAQLARAAPAGAGAGEAVLRGRALEIVDARGRVRASIRIHPAGQGPDGEPYPDTAILRLADPNGRPEVKLSATERGGALGLLGVSDATRALLVADGAETSLRLANADGRAQLVRP